MLSFTLGKLIRALTVLLGVSFLTFIVAHSSGDPVRLIARGDATEQQKAQLRHSLGLDRPVLEQYRVYVGNALHGDLGVSYRQHVDVSGLIVLRLPNSLELAGAAFLLATSLGFALGVLCVVYRDTVLDNLVAGLAVLAQVVPGFWLGLVLVLLFAVHWRFLPVSGSGDLAHLVLPAVTLALPTMGRITRLVRGGMLEVLRSDYIRTARAKGLSERQVLLGHAARNALLPLVTQAGLELGDLVGSAFIVETVFAWPGLGRMTVNAVQQRDFLVVQGCVLVIAAGFVLLNLAVDLLYAVIDPRVRARA
jgi:ABC-type dipeptide/oligopeptide/nickel transport system permease component